MTRKAGWLGVALACVGLGGCVTWDDVTSRDFTIKSMFVHPDPMYVLNNSHDGDKRAKALRSLREPLANGGTQKDQDAIVTVLVYAATNDQQALCRIAAISSLREFKDPRAAEGLKEAYYRASSFPPDSANVIRLEAISGLGHTGNPTGIDLLVKVLHEPPVEGPETDKQQKMDERIAAARALGNFKNIEAAKELIAAMKSDQEALHVPAHEALIAATGRHLPDDPKVWEDLLQTAPKDGNTLTIEPTFMDHVLDVLPVSFWK
jgi:HEAT repeat protein